MKNYIIKCTDNRCLEISESNSTILIYKIPYELVKNKSYDIKIDNRFIVYILYGSNDNGKDVIYVGKSKNGLDYRPTAHEDKYDNWTDCYILTNYVERTFLNDGSIQYLEDKIAKKVKELNTFESTTKVTVEDSANSVDKINCDDYLEKAYPMLYTLGLNLIDKKKIVKNDTNKSKLTPMGKKVQLTFDMIGIPIGSELTFVADENVKVKVVSNREVEYNGERYRVSAIAQKLLGYDYGVQGTLYFKYKGKTLVEIREEKGV